MTETEERRWAAVVCRPLFDAWGGGEYTKRPVALDGELTRLGLLAPDPTVVAVAALSPVGTAADDEDYLSAAALGVRCIALLDGAIHPAPFHLLRLTALACRIVGDTGRTAALLKRAVESTAGRDSVEAAQALAEYATHLVHCGDIATAEAHLRDAIRRFAAHGDSRQGAVAKGRLADILADRGELDEALRIYRDDEFPVYQTIGDIRGQAVVMGKVADILYARGEFDEALRIRRDDQIPIYETLGDIRGKAVALGRVADVLFLRGELDEALRIYRDEELPAYERLGDRRSKAVAMSKIADVLTAREEYDEALRIYRDELLPVFDQIGDVQTRALAVGKIADILTYRGQVDEALRLRLSEELPVFEKLGDVRLQVVCRSNIAITLLERGRPEDIHPAVEHLLWAHDAARRRGYKEASQIAGILNRLLGQAAPPVDPEST